MIYPIILRRLTDPLKFKSCWRPWLSTTHKLRQLRLVRSSLNEESAKTLVHAFVSSRLDYCNSLLYGVSDELLHKLQVIQNAADWSKEV